jgi:hypothetical protein
MRATLLLLSIYFFVQSTIFGGAIAYFLYSLAPPTKDGIPLSFSPQHLPPYFNMVLYVGLFLSLALFIVYAEPIVTRIFKNRRTLGIPITIAAVPFYFILLYLVSTGIKNLFS